MLIHELPPLFDGVKEVVDLTPATVDVRAGLRLPEQLTYGKYDLAEGDDAPELHPGTLLIGLIGPTAGRHTPPEDLAPALRRLPVGAHALLLVGWPVTEFPFHLLLGPLVDARCQVTEAVTLDNAPRHGAYLALVIHRVDALLPPRPYLMRDAARDPGAPQEAPDELRTALRVANEYALADLPSRAARRRVAELEVQSKELSRRVKTLEQSLQQRESRLGDVERRLADARQRLATLQSSATFQVGRAVIDGARHPGRAVVRVPVNLAKVWQQHRSRKEPEGTTPPAGQ